MVPETKKTHLRKGVGESQCSSAGTIWSQKGVSRDDDGNNLGGERWWCSLVNVRCITERKGWSCKKSKKIWEKKARKGKKGGGDSSGKLFGATRRVRGLGHHGPTAELRGKNIKFGMGQENGIGKMEKGPKAGENKRRGGEDYQKTGHNKNFV